MPDRLPSIRNAKLPIVYVDAQRALAKCQDIDECWDWADKAAAIASYAKQAQDETLLATATRIKARAIKRCGELLKAIEKSKGGRPSKTSMGAHTSSRSSVAADAGLSRNQRVTALRVASVPHDDFERAVESDDPPTITELSEAGKQAAANRAHRLGPKPPGFRHATQLLGTLERFASFCKEADPKQTAEAMNAQESRRAMRQLDIILDWVKQLKRGTR